jgi:hypothetical protein
MVKPRELVGAFFIVAFVLLYVVAATRPAKGFPPFVEYAKRLGYPAKDCTYCHVGLQGGSDKLNARGKWMVAEKVRRDAVAVDVKWLKDYKPGRPAPKAPAKKKG